MKNIHVLPTDKPSRLYFWEDKLRIGDLTTAPINLGISNQNIYITSDEEIKNGDWVITPTNDIIEWAKVFRPNGKKIILTTNTKLIRYGVQAIDDEFLEWLVKNPSCESVEVDSWSDDLDGYWLKKYKIIIPKEEPNREITFEEVFGEEKKKGLKEFIDKHKKETLEEAVGRLFNYHSNNTSLAEGHYDYMMDKEDFKQASYELAKWQQEQDKNKFSAEEVRRIAEWSFHFYKTNEFDDDELEAEWSRILDNDLKKK